MNIDNGINLVRRERMEECPIRCSQADNGTAILWFIKQNPGRDKCLMKPKLKISSLGF
jgi:hypothetical protein